MPKGYKLAYSDEEMEKIKSMYESGKTVYEIASAHGVSYTGMYNAMQRAGIEDFRSRRKYTVNEHVFDKIDNEEAAYWYGFIYADGCVEKTGLQISLAEKDRNQLVKIKKFLESNSPISKRDYYAPKKYQCGLSVYGTNLSSRLEELGITVGRPSHQPVLDNVPSDLIRHWIRGFFDGDGSATKSGRIVFCGSEELMVWLRDYLAERVGINPDLKIHPHQSGSVYYLSIGRSIQARKVTNFMYENATIWMPRKRKMVDSWPKFDPSTRAKKGWEARRKNKRKSAD